MGGVHPNHKPNTPIMIPLIRVLTTALLDTHNPASESSQKPQPPPIHAKAPARCCSSPGDLRAPLATDAVSTTHDSASL